jgi:zinc/manganese transport system substrate-binding protein
VGQDLVDVAVLSAPTEDPHFVDAKPDRVLLLSRADLLVFTGMDLEIGWLPVLLTSSRNERIQPGSAGYLDCSTLITPKEVPLQKLDRSMGDVHPGGNPHYTKDPRNAVLIARGIKERLSELDPAHASSYQKNEAVFEKTVDEKSLEWRKALVPFKGAPIVTYHKSWIYFTDWAGLDQVGFIEPKPGIPPSTSHVANLFALMRAKSVAIVLQEQWYSAQTSELLAKNTGARVVRVPGMAGPSQSYVDYMAGVVADVVRGLSPKGS